MPLTLPSGERIPVLVLLAATALAIYVCYLLARPFLPSIVWALAFAVAAQPLHRWLDQRIRRPNLSAGIAVAIVAVIVVAPALYVTQSFGHEVAKGIEWLDSEGATELWQLALERYPRLVSLASWLAGDLGEGGEGQTSGVASVLTGSARVVTQLLVTFFALFYFFRDRQRILSTLRSLVPLSSAETEAIFTRVTHTIHATVYGTLVVAMAQGTLGGLMFWILDIPAPLLWGVVMALLAVVPVLGAFIVWVPATVYLALQGSWGQAALLAVWGLFVISLVDNLLYPILVGKRLRLHTLPVFFAIVGGILLFGSAGVVLGPVILAVTWALLELWRGRSLERGAA
jgi:predicted PurR-regulated permease PerM